MLKYRILIVTLLFTISVHSQTLFPVGTGLKGDDNVFMTTSHVEKYGSLYFIAGDFDTINSQAIKNFAIWDGENFENGATGLDETILERRVEELLVFEDKLYMWFQGAGSIFVWSDSGWELFIQDEINGGVVIDNKLFFYGNNIVVDNSEPADLVYYTNDNWFKKNVNYNFPNEVLDEFYGINGLAKWHNKIVISTDSGWHDISFLDSTGNLTAIDTTINLGGKLTSIQDKLFVLDSWTDHDIYEYRDGRFDYLLEVDEEFHGFFELENELYLGSIYEGTYIYKDDGFILRGTDHLSVFDIAELNEDEYLIVGKLFFGSDYSTRLYDLATMRYEKPVVEIDFNKDVICENEYIYFVAKDNDIYNDYAWTFEGGIPSKSNVRNPSVKFSNPGVYEVTLVTNNVVGKSDTLRKEILVINGCDIDVDLNYDNVWIMGYDYDYSNTIGGLDFSIGEPQSVKFNAPISMWNLSFSICDTDGDLLFYSNGSQILDYNHLPIQNSDNFNTGDYISQWGDGVSGRPQSMICIPSELYDSIYYILHLPQDYVGANNSVLPTRLMMSQINVDDSRELDMVVQDIPLIEDTLQNYTMQAHKHLNGEDWWVLLFKLNSVDYYRVLLKPDGTSVVDKEQLDDVIDNNIYQTVFAPNGSKFVLVDKDNKQTKLWDFDSQTGILSNSLTIESKFNEDTDLPLGCAFSPNSRFLYVASYHYMKQYDLCSEDIFESEVIVGEWDGFYDWIYPFSFGRMRLGPNNKIYSSSYSAARFLSTIHEPNLKGLDCEFIQHDLMVEEGNYFTSNIVPEFPHYRNVLDSVDCSSLNVNLEYIEEAGILEIHPNPVMQNLKIESTENIKDCNVTIYNSVGKVVMEFIYDRELVSVDELSSGMYYIKLEVNGRSISRQFFKM